MFDPKEVLALCEKATPGPWQIIEQGKLGRFVLDGNNNYALEMDYPENDNFVVVARAVLPELAQRVIELEGKVDPYWMNKAQELEKENAKLRAVAEAAKGIEWVYGGDNLEGMWLLCPCCGKGEIDGHNDDCKLHQALVAAGYGGEE